MYVDYEFYKSLYGEELTETEFKRLSFQAEVAMDKATSGVDNVKKLKVAFPTDEYDAEIVKHCVCAVIDFMHQLEQIERASNSAVGYVQREDGTLQGKVVSSVSAGNESISYSNEKIENDTTTASKSASNKEVVIYNMIQSNLRGVTDANGVYLLYAGVYPYEV